jgi:uncharacterized membrane protein YhfC
MNATLSRALISLLPTSMLFCGSVLLFLRRRAFNCFLQVIGAGALVMVVLAHIAEALDAFPLMQLGGRKQHWTLPRPL